MALKDFEYDILRWGARGHFVRGVWSFYNGDKPVTREVRTLLKRGHVSITYYSDLDAGVNITDAGRKRLYAIFEKLAERMKAKGEDQE